MQGPGSQASGRVVAVQTPRTLPPQIQLQRHAKEEGGERDGEERPPEPPPGHQHVHRQQQSGREHRQPRQEHVHVRAGHAVEAAALVHPRQQSRWKCNDPLKRPKSAAWCPRSSHFQMWIPRFITRLRNIVSFGGYVTGNVLSRSDLFDGPLIP